MAATRRLSFDFGSRSARPAAVSRTVVVADVYPPGDGAVVVATASPSTT